MKANNIEKAEEVSIPIVKEILARIPAVRRKQTAAKMLLAKRIHDAYTQRGLNKKQFAELVSKKPGIITRWLSGDHNFEVDTLVEIEHALGIKLLVLEEEKVVQSKATNQITIVNKVINTPVMPSYMSAYSVVSSERGNTRIIGASKRSEFNKSKTQRGDVWLKIS